MPHCWHSSRAADRSSACRPRATELHRQAVTLTGSAQGGSSQAFSLEAEPPRVRDRYGDHRFGKAMLLARRLAEAGVPMIAIHFNEMTLCDGWDLHSKNFEGLKDELLPMLDQGLSALIQDLRQRGLFEETLVVVMGEFGRTPRINKQAGRDHWGSCSSVVLAGGGIRGGVVYGSSDKLGGLSRIGPCRPRGHPGDAVSLHGAGPRTDDARLPGPAVLRSARAGSSGNLSGKDRHPERKFWEHPGKPGRAAHASHQ